MFERHIYITEFDDSRLRALIDETRRLDHRHNEYLDSLEAELARSTTLSQQEIPPDVITMNSTFKLLDLDTQEVMEYTLVFPNDADLAQAKLSVLAPIGTAALGYSVGDTFTWTVPDGLRRMKVIAVTYQPEAAGDYHL